MEKCYFCRGEIVKRRIRHVHSWKNKIILFKDLPAEVCKQCGEEYFSPAVVEMMDKATLHLERIKETIKIPVVPYAELAV